MNRYRPSTPRTLFAAVAAVFTLLTVAALVILPAQVDWPRAAPSPLAQASTPGAVGAPVAGPADDAATRFVRIEVVGKSAGDLAMARGQTMPTKL